jgi:competence protein ComEC
MSFLLLMLFLLGEGVSADLTIHYIDVGQGDSALIQYAGKSLLIDAGSYDIGNAVLSVLRKAGVNKLNVVVASHPHSDHIGGMLDVIRAYPPDLYIDNGEVYDNPSYEPLMQFLVTKQIPYAVGKTGKIIPFADGVSVSITHPSENGSDINENSLALLITYGSVRFFFPGDCETCDADADVVKLAHHGSKGSATRALLSGTKPKAVIISLAKDNEYHFPAYSTITALEKAGVVIHRTDLEGTIILHSDGTTYRFE